MRFPSHFGGSTTEEVGFFACRSDALASWIHEGVGPGWQMREPKWLSADDAMETLRAGGQLTHYACVQLVDWSLLLTNGPRGTDVGALPSQAARELGIRCVRAAWAPHDALFPARIFQVFGPSGEPPLALERSVVAANDGGKWVFELVGEPFEFEDQDSYEKRTKSERFTADMLERYLRALEIPVDAEPDWSAAWLVERV